MSNADRVLLADIGGTNARFALADPASAVPLLDDSVREFVVADFPSLADAAQHYLDETGATAQNGVFAVAGRVDPPHRSGVTAPVHPLQLGERVGQRLSPGSAPGIRAPGRSGRCQ